MKKDTLRPSEISAFCTQMSMILRSGISISEGIGIMHDDSADQGGREILSIIHQETELGAPLYMALDKTQKFPEYVVNMAEIGEAAGRLEGVMESLSSYYEREEAVSRLIRNAITYPLVMVAMMIAVIVILIVQVMPVFNDVFQGLGAQMTGFPLAVMNMGQLLWQYSIVIVAVLAVLFVAAALMSSTSSGKAALEHFRDNFFLTRSLYSKIASGRFASAMAMMMASGMDTDKSLEMVHKLVSTPSVRLKIEMCQQKIGQGVRFSDALAQAGMFSGIYAKMLSVAFRTGSMEKMMEKLASRYEEETTTQINNIISIVEPSIVAILSVVVGIILLSVMLPLMGIMSAII